MIYILNSFFIVEIADNLCFYLDLFTNWIIEACAFWEKNEYEPSTNVACFVLHLGSFVSRNEERFLKLSSINAYLRLCDIFCVRKYSTLVQVKQAYVSLLESFLEHRYGLFRLFVSNCTYVSFFDRSGVEWIRATNSWTDVLNYCLMSNPIKESYNFIYKLLESRVLYDEKFCNTIVKKILQPLDTVGDNYLINIYYFLCKVFYNNFS